MQGFQVKSASIRNETAYSPGRLRWLIAGMGLGLLLAGLLWHWLPQPAPETIVRNTATRVAILQAPGLSSTPGWLVSVNSRGELWLQPRVRTEPAPGTITRLWAYDAPLAAPRPLAVLDPNAPAQLDISSLNGLGPEPFLEITQEPADISRATEPRGPVLFIGRMLSLPAAPVPDAQLE